MSISASTVKELREKTGAGMMDCKNALTENNGDIEAAIDWLRTKGLAKAAKKAGRVAAEGLIGLASAQGRAALVEVNAETDFVARNDQFQALVMGVAEAAVSSDDEAGTLAKASYAGGSQTVEEVITSSIATIGENMSLRRSCSVSVNAGVVASYMHGSIAEGLGKIGVLVALESEAEQAALHELGKQIAMHIAASSPLALSDDDVDSALLERERTVYAEQARESGKPDNIIEKMVEGRIRKYLEEIVLLKQSFVVDPDKTVEQAVKDAEKSLGAAISVTEFHRFGLGEGIEKEEVDFAAEVAAVAGA